METQYQNFKPANRVKTFQNERGQIIGWFKGGVYRKRVDPRKHKMKIYNAYGIEEKVIIELAELGCTEIRFQEIDTGNVLASSYDTWIEHGFVKNHETEQRFLPMRFFTTG